jgi:Superfamily II DNA and RNA helicases
MSAGRDCVALAPTGTGKTCAFGIPLIININPELYAVQSIVMCPTRELAMQTEAELRKLSKFTEGVRVLAIYGGQNIERQLYGLRKKPQILVCTPGRLIDHLSRRTVSLSAVGSVVLDEADEMLDMGFRDDISAILTKVREGAQVTMFSATMSNDIRALSEGYQHNPISVGNNYDERKPDILQYVIRLKEASKMDALESIMMANALKFVLVFCNTKRKVDAVNKELNARGFLAASLPVICNSVSAIRL